MLCEKCQQRPATVHITQVTPGPAGGKAPSQLTRNFCESCAREFTEAHPEFKRATLARSEVLLERPGPPGPNLPEPENPLDTSRRYDVYCAEPLQRLVVYRNALLKKAVSLLPSRWGRVTYPDFVELEQENGQSIFIPRGSIFRLCVPGTALVGEVVPK